MNTPIQAKLSTDAKIVVIAKKTNQTEWKCRGYLVESLKGVEIYVVGY